MSELVLVVPRTAVVRGEGWHGVRTEGVAGLLELITGEGQFRLRADVESDPGWKQVIPYLVVRDGAAWFLMQRTRAGVDVRLHDRWSIGVGGHINPGDEGVLGGLHREWIEEIEADFVPQPRLVGLLNDDSTEVGRVHLGVVFEADAAGRPLAIRETSKLSGRFVPVGEVRAVADRLETWSRLVLDCLDVPGRGAVRL